MKGIDNIQIAVNEMTTEEVVDTARKTSLHISKRVLKAALNNTDNYTDDYQLLQDEYYRILDLLADRHL
jgi:hypothetical protein